MRFILHNWLEYQGSFDEFIDRFKNVLLCTNIRVTLRNELLVAMASRDMPAISG